MANTLFRQHGTKNYYQKWSISKDDFNFILERENHVEELLAEANSAAIKALNACGLVAEGHAKKLCKVDTGRLRNSITFDIEENDGEGSVSIGTNVEYGIYVEMGTGIHAANGDGRPTPWSYKDAQGKWHRTRGQKPQPFIKPAVADHMSQYRKIIQSELGAGMDASSSMDINSKDNSGTD